MGMLPDGSNPEGADPEPPLAWASAADLKGVVLHGHYFSPPTAKIRAHLLRAGVPFEFKVGMNKAGSKHYKMMPVIDVAGRQVNDSFVILRHLVPACSGDFDEGWERRIVFEFQTALEVQLSETPDQCATFLCKMVPAPHFIMRWLLVRVVAAGWRKKIARRPLYKNCDPLAFAKEFAASLRDGGFFHGARPGHVDVSFYGTLAPFVVSVPMGAAFVKSAGLAEWWARMVREIPLTGSPRSLFPNEKLAPRL